MKPTTPPLLQTQGLQKVFQGVEPVEAVAPINLTIHSGEFLSIVGSSGSGKSTLMNLLGLLDTPTAGALLYDGEPTQTWNEKQKALFRNKAMGFIFQAHLLLPDFTALENVLLPAWLLHGPNVPKATQALAKSLLQRIGLEHRLQFKPRQLSGGQNQRVAIARALINTPRIVFADEPTGALDSATSQQVMALMKQLHKEEGTTFVVVTHEKALAAQTYRCIELQDGHVLSDKSLLPV
jgi:ABC-type lipoprotein export system ATPase subunit